ncbi:acyltransferase family protein [Lederbergia citri]|uniref:Acyltransferase n=1 Tax=Lederbergia citri TaxID=2833580 RepID=A0A942YGQ3_9BACI|nr:acyltransferase [Lederbergia citri]MBS4196428.1 acyltransferase [Lederbergia citri]
MTRKRLVLIQFSRALVPIMVMLFHLSLTMHEYFDFNLFGLHALPMSGGVSYFFALSGFMMYYVYRNHFGQMDQMKKYVINRFIRIYPLYWILTIVLLPFLFIFPWYGVGHETELETIISSFLLSPNPSGEPPVLIPAWSLKFTVLFYLMFSLLFLPRPRIAMAILAIWGGLCAAVFIGYIPVYNFITEFLLNEINLILLGGILAAYVVTHVRINWFFSFLFAITGFLGFPFMWKNSLNPIININFDLGTGFASILLIIGIASIDLKKDIRIPKQLNYLGNAAFSIYLSHNLALDFFSEVFSRFPIYETIGGWILSIVFFVIMISFGSLVHSYFETPLINILRKRLLRYKVKIKGVKTVVVRY